MILHILQHSIKHNQLHKQAQHYQRTFLKACNLIQIAYKTKHEIQLLIKNRQADVITMQELKLNQSHKTQKIPHFTLFRTDCNHKQGGLLT